VTARMVVSFERRTMRPRCDHKIMYRYQSFILIYAFLVNTPRLMTASPDPTTTAATGILDEHRSSPGLLLALLGQEAMRRLRAAHTAHDLKPRQFQILGLLQDHGGLAQGELIHEMGVAPSILVTLLNPLEADGLVTRERDPGDRRRHLVTLTDAGKQHLASASRAQKEAEEALFASLDETQREQLRTLLIALRDGLGADPEQACSTDEAAR
jgi:DNA-binding MarR family transcriptional regulator